ncbi:lipopolysaccharide assembly protein LapA domain-containing protein [Chelativorans intermedius]|uniref:Lipopolysaccharide assembly protein LapA domain-containing protein n=1 Tax=Chelativorans intermedius TaxID=515947 RepID=A0ABV6DDA9_9HYPH|nr:lipopolysaccharide assembly protein LapA domain-containing protein [Chelativorans intermedius]MCT8999102.1 lipopolysaccharide assembly protein LapA domain-containing protein [Chelativorans intermedius]
MLNRIVIVLVFVPLAIVLIALAVANRAATPFTLDPFHPGNPGLTVEMPLFVYLFAALVIGLFVGSFVTWFRQRRYRRIARERSQEMERLRAAERQKGSALAPTDG